MLKFDRWLGSSTAETPVECHSDMFLLPSNSATSQLCKILGPCFNISDERSYRKISWNLEATRFVFGIVRSLWNLPGTSAAVPDKFQSDNLNYQSRGSDTYDRRSYRILKQGPGWWYTVFLNVCRWSRYDYKVEHVKCWIFSAIFWYNYIP